jgi:putative PIN family toxin of toxin-antitoxin system
VTEPHRVVFDTNVFVSATLSKSLTSPTRELLARWEREEFVLVTCEALVTELIEKLLEYHVQPASIALLVASLARLAEWVTVHDEEVIPVLADPDDDIVLACAVSGRANYIVTYDPHFDVLHGVYRTIQIVKALPFLWTVRGDQPPEVDAKST